MLALPILLICMLGAALGTTLAPSRDRTLSELHHTSWTAKDGVPGEISALAQTSDGYLWLGTANGLYRYDGARFEPYEPPQGQRFPAHIVESLMATPDEGLFIGFRDAGASFLKNGNVTTYAESEGRPLGTIRGFARARDGTVWVAANYGLFRLVGSQWQRVGSDWNYPWLRAQATLVDRDGTLWVAGNDGIVFLPEGQSQFHKTAENVVDRVFEVNCIVQAPDGKIWIGETSHSLRPIVIRPEEKSALRPPEIIVGSYGLLFDDAGSLWIASLGDGVGRIRFPEQLDRGGIQQFRAAAEIFSEKDGLSSDYVSPVLEDREGNIWVGTSTGLDRFQETSVVPSALPAGSRDMLVIPGDHGDLWTGSLNRALTHVEGRSVAVQNQDVDWGNTCGYRDSDGTLWLGGPIGIRHVVEGRFLTVPLPPGTQSGWIVAITKGGPGVLWAAIGRSGVYRLSEGVWEQFGSQEGLPEGIPTNMFTDSEGRVWMGYLRGRLAVFEGDRFRTFSDKDGIAAGHVMTVYEHGPHLWIGGEFGLQVFAAGRFRKINVADEAKFRGISGIVETANGDLWLNAANGIVHIPASEVQHALEDSTYLARSEAFDYLDGLTGTSAGLRARPTAVQGTDGRLWFSLASGVVWIDPNHLRKNSVAPPVYISSVSAGGKEYLTPGALNLPMRTTNIQIAYTALSISVPERVRFRYKLDGVDKDWQDPGSRRQAFYTNLGPGPHRFQVLASNNDGVWNETAAKLEFNIAPAFYQTNWFLLICGAAFACILWAAYQWRIRQVAAHLDSQFEERLVERTRIAQDLHDTLLQGILSASMQLHVANDQLAVDSPAKRIVIRVLDLMRQVVDDGRNAVRGLRSSIAESDDLEQALSRIPQEFAPQQPIDFRVIVEGQARPLHPLIRDEVYRVGHEALANAFRHSQASGIEVELEYDDSQLRVLVRDNGCGIDPEVLRSGRDGHWGLSGMRERAERIGARVKVWSRPAGGTEVELSVPGDVAFRHYASGGGLRWLSRIHPRKAEREIQELGSEREDE